MFDPILQQEAYALGFLEAEAGKPRQTAFLGDDLRDAYFRGWDAYHAARQCRERAA